MKTRKPYPKRVNPESLIGQVFGRLTVTGVIKGAYRGETFVSTLCSCGAVGSTRPSALLSGCPRSCGCLRDEVAVTLGHSSGTHHLSKTPEYMVWKAIKRRCYNKNSSDYPLYGGRGIEVSQEWVNDPVQFIADMGLRPPGTSIERRDSNGDYSKINCYWATPEVQANNTSRNTKIAYQGEYLTLAQWSKKLGVNYSTVRHRHALGWEAKDVLDTRRRIEVAPTSLTHKGHTHTISEWSRITGIKYTTLLYRQKKGLCPEAILNPVVRGAV